MPEASNLITPPRPVIVTGRRRRPAIDPAQLPSVDIGLVAFAMAVAALAAHDRLEAPVDHSIPVEGGAACTARATRRQIFGASAALLLTGVTEARTVQVAGPDDELLGLVDELEAAKAWLDRHEVGSPHKVSDTVFRRHLARYWDIADQIEALQASTAEGLQAKARTVRSVWWCLGRGQDCHMGKLCGHLESLLNNMLGDPTNGRAEA